MAGKRGGGAYRTGRGGDGSDRVDAQLSDRDASADLERGGGLEGELAEDADRVAAERTVPRSARVEPRFLGGLGAERGAGEVVGDAVEDGLHPSNLAGGVVSGAARRRAPRR